MAVDTTWSSPATASGSGGTDLAAGDTLSETVWDRVQSNLYRLGGTDGLSHTSKYQIGGTQTYSNANNTGGLNINQGANDDEIVSLKSSDVAHGVTALTETDTFGYLKKTDPSSGGLTVVGASEGIIAFNGSGVATTPDTTTGTAAVAAVKLDANLKSGTGLTNFAATANLFAITTNALARFIVKGDGDVHNNGGSTAMGTYDDADDLALVETVGTLMRPERAGDYRFRLAEAVRHEEFARFLHDHGVITMDWTTREFFISYKGMLGLLIDTLRQEGHRLRALEARVAPLLAA